MTHAPTTPPMNADVIIVGCGPSGMAAAVELATAGCSVIVMDMQPAPGGQIFRNLEANTSGQNPGSRSVLAALGPSYLAGTALIERFRACKSIDYRSQTTVWEVRTDGTVGWLRGMEAGYVRAPCVLLAHGAMERPAPFPGWTLPGVMTAGAVQTLLKAGNLKPSGNIVLAGTGPLLLLLATQLCHLGVKPALIGRTDNFSHSLTAMRHLRGGGLFPIIKGVGWLARLKAQGIRTVSGLTHLAAEGAGKVEAVSFSARGRRERLPCDLLIVHDGIVPAIDIPNGAGLALQWDQTNASWRPHTTTDGQATPALPPEPGHGHCAIRITGDARRIGGADAAIAHGRLAAQAILAEQGKGAGITPQHRKAVSKALSVRPFLDTAFPPGLSASLPDDATIVCRCEELSAGTLRAKIHAGFNNMDALRGETRCGMGPCQGRNCMVSAARLIMEAHNTSAPVPPTFRGRPPIRPLPLGALASLTGLDPRATELLTLEDKPEHDQEDMAHDPAE